ncbi:MAG TPA: hypothetical protein VFR09_04505 [Alphaproteobacteria bacterium]|nr:hypothetical protein [Alphaproteobacteria bacterium]
MSINYRSGLTPGPSQLKAKSAPSHRSHARRKARNELLHDVSNAWRKVSRLARRGPARKAFKNTTLAYLPGIAVAAVIATAGVAACNRDATALAVHKATASVEKVSISVMKLVVPKPATNSLG